MRILMVQTYHYYRGGDSTCMFNLTRLLEQEGHEVVPFAMQHPQNLASPYSEYFSSEIDFPKMLEDFSLGTAISVVSKSIYNREAKAR
ncbi:MAG: glycosyltransferase family 1 protein, partial [Candidatus Krumholzibacteria bacterium]|nr:glycosyltransferase family 1 protein [Candidatus Krumholzibacteria bacterium]